MISKKQLNNPRYNQELRQKVYASYNALLRTGMQPTLEFPNYLEESGLVYCSGKIDDNLYNGTTYLCGKIFSKEDLGDGLLGIVVTTDNPLSIEPFEHYSKRGIRSAILTKKGLIINRTVLEKNPDELESHTIEEVIGLNFSHLPNLMSRLSLSEEEYLKFYMEIWSKNPLLL